MEGIIGKRGLPILRELFCTRSRWVLLRRRIWDRGGTKKKNSLSTASVVDVVSSICCCVLIYFIGALSVDLMNENKL